MGSLRFVNVHKLGDLHSENSALTQNVLGVYGQMDKENSVSEMSVSLSNVHLNVCY